MCQSRGSGRRSRTRHRRPGTSLRARSRRSSAAARDADIRVVLLRAVDVIRKRVVDRDVIELRGRLVLQRRPGLAAIDRDARAAIVRVREPMRIFRIDPESVMIAMARGQELECLAAIDRAERARYSKHKPCRRRIRVRVNFAEIPGPLPEAAVVVDLRPIVAAIFRAKDAAFFRLDDRVNAIRIRAGNSHADAAKNSLRQTVALAIAARSFRRRSSDKVRCPVRRWRKTTAAGAPARARQKAYSDCADRKRRRCRRCFRLCSRLSSRSFRHRSCGKFRAPAFGPKA